MVSVLISSGVYVFPLIVPPPETTDQVPDSQLVAPSCTVPLLANDPVKPDVLVFQ